MSELFSSALKVSAYGMLGVFAFMLIFYLLVVFLRRQFPQKAQEESKQE